MCKSVEEREIETVDSNNLPNGATRPRGDDKLLKYLGNPKTGMTFIFPTHSGVPVVLWGRYFFRRYISLPPPTRALGDCNNIHFTWMMDG